MVEITLFDVKVQLYRDFEVTVDATQYLWQVPETVYFVEKPDGFAGRTMHNFCQVAGFDWTKIDPAVPQSWFEEYMRKHNGQAPKAWWNYGGSDPTFGTPLFISTVIEAYLKAIQLEVLRLQGTGELPV